LSSTKIKIHWNGFLEICCKAYPKEACAMLYAKKPFSEEQEWFVYPIKNVHPEPCNGWQPDNKELSKIKRQTDKEGLVKIGNVHSHPLPPVKDHQELSDDEDMCDMWKRYSEPSDIDLQFARKFNDIIRGILVVDSEGVYEHGWHDKFGNMFEMFLIEEVDSSQPLDVKQEGGNGVPPTPKECGYPA